MNFGDWNDWDHITKLDPDKDISREDVVEVCDSGTDAIMVGGTQRITEEKIHTLTEVLREKEVPLTLEPSNPSAVVHDVDWVFVPTVLNAGDVLWVTGAHKEWVKDQRDEIRWDRTAMEGYIVLNPDSAVAELTNSYTDIDADDVASYAVVGEKAFNLPIIYVEYSGTYGDPDVVEEVSEALEDAALFYGGGIDSYEKAEEMAEYADTVVVGDAVYDEGVEALRQTVEGAKSQ